MAGNHLCKGAFAGTVRAHDRVNFAGLYGKCQAVQDLFVADTGAEIFDF